LSALSKAIARAEKRIEAMTQEDRERFYIHILQEELRRGLPKRAAPPPSITKGEG
jgi:hypothetical protein